MKGKEEASETMLNEKEASQLLDNEFKELVIRKLHELTHNDQKLQGNYNELTANYINLSLIHISEPTRRVLISRMPSSA